jgi:hypothetical protein
MPPAAMQLFVFLLSGYARAFFSFVLGKPFVNELRYHVTHIAVLLEARHAKPFL